MNKGHQQQYGRGFVLAAVALAGFGLVNAQPTQAATSANGSASQAVEQASAVKSVAAKDQTLVFALLNGIAANYHQAITVQIVAADNGQVVATKTLASTDEYEPSASISGLKIGAADGLQAGHTYRLQVVASGNQGWKAVPDSFVYTPGQTTKIEMDKYTYQKGERAFQLVDQQTKQPLANVKVAAIPNLVDGAKSAIVKTTDAQGRVTFSTDDPQFKRNVFYHFELPDKHVTVGYNWNLIGGEKADDKAAVVSVKMPAVASSSSQASQASSQASQKPSQAPSQKPSQKPSIDPSAQSSQPSLRASSSASASQKASVESVAAQTSQAASSAESGSTHGLPKTGEALGQSGLLAGLATLLSALGAWLWRRQG
ncbi:LPXTG cell wall anchor domain-containing protein [Lacticaseibacillus casei]|jgi:LPXTG-motif cell wall-anchored protein|uniref:LPXTG cell wall anchor domain-containing protein n=1 Tax=Lacticaseibacillus huelsenbergensis TaxID=3035291 RepID=A0ABY8DU28_9LACO|nr:MULTISPECIES: LPXTG cell wall anchor domain-containing protein [Lacticaseibacillus]MDG3062239.1 LPXTG cell wall anchor domain-containing protein [Lacticaseibacillus sp. BCRC 81376]QVI36226.1 LPXTG cell wall anchor domain-containing protein [Lacticaseibacillus casei]QXG58023.1 LPXTG cell wall anchor domain-containing protein [Lacticaseibacillus casei]WFB40504.1 LPXTG cell wall anchor domain-containing protein [Lacticaseibacillus huelsenbergensis]WFB42254.1 LPXTG cell wall anchor domain-conta